MWWILASASAQDIAVPNLNAQLFRPTIDGRGTLWVDDVRGGEDGVITPRMLLHYTGQPVSYRYASGASVPVFGGVAMGDALLGYRKGPLRLGVDVPVVLSAEGLAAGGEFGLGDVVADVQGVVVDDALGGFGVTARYGFPTATTLNPLGSPRGDVELLAVGRLAVVDGWVDVLLNAGVGAHPGVAVEGVANTQIRGRAAVTMNAWRNSGVALEAAGRLPLGAGTELTADAPMEGMLTAWARDGAAVLRGGVGTGLNAGIGASDLRAVIGLEWGKQPPPPDADGDGIIDADDQCRLEPEDVDGVLDADGCVDLPPKLIVDLIGADGTPVTGRVQLLRAGEAVGTRDAGAMWTLEPGTYEIRVIGAGSAANGGVAQFVTLEPTDTLRTTQVQVARPGTLVVEIVGPDGQPVVGSVFGKKEKLGEGSVFTGELLEGEHGLVVRAPGFRPARQVVTVVAGGTVTARIELQAGRAALDADRITLRESVRFESGSATLLPASEELLDEVAAILADHPRITLLRVEGHTDVVGDAAANLRLSQQRAAAVKAYLVGAGVAAERLDAVGYGETKPLVPGDTDAANEQNRRVDFFVAVRAPEATP